MPPPTDWLTPAWPTPAGVVALQTTRADRTPSLPGAPCWLEQVHGAGVVAPRAGEQGLVGDAAVTCERGTVLAVRTADCLPVLFCRRDGGRAAHRRRI